MCLSTFYIRYVPMCLLRAVSEMQPDIPRLYLQVAQLWQRDHASSIDDFKGWVNLRLNFRFNGYVLRHYDITLHLITQCLLLYSQVSGDQISHFMASRDLSMSYKVCKESATDLDIPNNPFISPNHQFRVLANPSRLSVVKCNRRFSKGVCHFEAEF